jgi:hypothetical protein
MVAAMRRGAAEKRCALADVEQVANVFGPVVGDRPYGLGPELGVGFVDVVVDVFAGVGLGDVLEAVGHGPQVGVAGVHAGDAVAEPLEKLGVGVAAGAGDELAGGALGDLDGGDLEVQVGEVDGEAGEEEAVVERDELGVGDVDLDF